MKGGGNDGIITDGLVFMVEPSTIKDLDNNGKLFTYSSKKYFTHSDILNIMTDAEWRGTQSYLG